jgi:hypothetical protein
MKRSTGACYCSRATVPGGAKGLRTQWQRAVRWLALPGKWQRVAMLVGCVVVLAMYCTNRDMGGDPDSPRGDGTYRPVLARGDGHQLYLMARSTALDLDWRFDNDFARFGDPWNEPRTRTGRKAIVHPIGPALVWTPLIWVAEAGAVVANTLGADIPLHGYTLWHQRFVFLTSVVFGCGSVLLARRLAQRCSLGRWAPTYAALAVLLGTSLTYYSTYMPSYSHAMDAFACAGFLAYWTATLGRTDVRRWILLGVLLGAAALVRVQEIATGVVVAIEALAAVVTALRRRERVASVAGRWLGGGALVLVVAGIVWIPQLVEWQIVFGKFTELPQGHRFTRFEAPMIGEVLFAPRNGWLVTTPLAYLGLVGLLLAPRRLWLVTGALLAVVAIQVFLNSTVLDWWSGASFGQRRLCNVSFELVVGLAVLCWRVGRLLASRLPVAAIRACAVVVVGAFVGWNLVSVGDLTHGRAAPDALSPSCCDNVPSPLRGPVRWLYDRIGNPFELPASAVFAIAHGVPLSRWDQTVGNYPLLPGLAELHDDAAFFRVRGTWNLGAPDIEPYLVDGWSEIRRANGRSFRFTTARVATVLVPNLVPDGQRLTLWLAAGGARVATVRWNGDIVAHAELTDGWTPVVFDLPDIAIHTNELAVEAEPALLANDKLGSEPGPVGVAVSRVDFELLH